MENETKKTIVDFLTLVGFKELGTNQFLHDKFGLIFLESYEPEKVFNVFLRLGAAHRVHQIKKLLEVDEKFMFAPSASEDNS